MAPLKSNGHRDRSWDCRVLIVEGQDNSAEWSWISTPGSDYNLFFQYDGLKSQPPPQYFHCFQLWAKNNSEQKQRICTGFINHVLAAKKALRTFQHTRRNHCKILSDAVIISKLFSFYMNIFATKLAFVVFKLIRIFLSSYLEQQITITSN